MSENAPKTYGFKSEIKQLLKLMVHSLYSNKEVFLRELISNAADAAEKLRFKALSDAALMNNDEPLRLRISVDKSAKQITFSDNAIGMTEEEVVEQLGTIAHSGTKAFLEAAHTENAKPQELIGQFGVGFYSAFIVANAVEVHTRAAGTPPEQGVLWTSSGEGEYSVLPKPKAQPGTEITLTLRATAEEFLEPWKLRSLIKQYSDHLSLPVELQVEADADQEASGLKWEQVNRAKALWMRPKKEISEEEYKAFYREVTHDWNEPLLWSHHRVEGLHEYTTLLYLPKKAPWNLWERDTKQGIKLYVQRVFILEDARLFLPPFLRFVRGVIDSNDLPLNVSREMLQETEVTEQLKHACTKRVLQMLDQLAKADPKSYQEFWKEFGVVLKDGVTAKPEYKEKLLPLLRFSSTATETAEGQVSLNDYVSRMKENQQKIYVLTADTLDAAKSSPHLEIFEKQGLEVLLLTDKIDEWVLSYIPEFDGKPLQLISSSDLELEGLVSEEADTASTDPEQLEGLVARLKALFGERVKAVKLTQRLQQTPCVVTTASGEISARMAKLLTAAGREIPPVQYALELNPQHVLIQRLERSEGNAFRQLAELLLDQAILAEQGTLDNPHAFIQRMNKMLEQASEIG